MDAPYQTPQQSSDVRSFGSSSKKRLKSISPLKAGIVLGALYVLMTLVMLLIFAPFFLLGVSTSNVGFPESIGTGIGVLIIAPVMYGIVGFIGGVICAWIYNFVAKLTGGLVVTVEDV